MRGPAMKLVTPPLASLRHCGVTLFAIVAVALFALVAIPAEAHASPATSVLVDGIDIATDPDNTLEFGKGVATYDKATGVLTLENVTISNSDEYAIIRPQRGQLTLNLVGDNTLSGSGRGIYASTGEVLSITGAGSLTIDTNGEAIQVDTIDLMCDGCTLNLYSDGWCMSAWGGTISVQNGANVTATTEGSGAVAVTGEDGVSVNSATLNAETTSNGSGPALYTMDSISASNSSVISTSAGYCGILAQNTVAISNSTVHTTGAGGSSGYGISTVGAIEVSGASDLLSKGGFNASEVIVSPASGSLVDVKTGVRDAVSTDFVHFGGSPISVETTFDKSSGLGDHGCVHIVEHSHVFDQQITSDATLVNKATCSTAARYYLSCACGEVGTDTFEYGEPLDHDWNDWTVTKAPTCTETGAERRTCKRGDAQEARAIDALGHDLARVEAVAPTCTEAGVAEHWVCSRCGALFADAAGTVPTTVEKLAVEATGHNFKDGTCTVCDAKDPDFTEPEKKPASEKEPETEIPAAGDPASVAPALAGLGTALLGMGAVFGHRSRRAA